jgi:type IV fimbrial biogenesis protein FimT
MKENFKHLAPRYLNPVIKLGKCAERCGWPAFLQYQPKGAHSRRAVRKDRHHECGFTLTELMVTLAIGTFVITMTAPLGNFIQSTRSTAAINEFITFINLARNEAITRVKPVTLCPSLDGLQCGGEEDPERGAPWHQGWIIFVDHNGNGVVNGRDRILKKHRPLPAGFSFYSSVKKRITFRESGISVGFMDTWKLCGPKGKAQFTRGVVLSFVGRARSAEDTNNNGILDNGARNGSFEELVCPV